MRFLRRVILPIHVPEEHHWVVACIDFAKKRVTIYDSWKYHMAREGPWQNSHQAQKLKVSV